VQIKPTPSPAIVQAGCNPVDRQRDTTPHPLRIPQINQVRVNAQSPGIPKLYFTGFLIKSSLLMLQIRQNQSALGVFFTSIP
jgi:hypothetical protein